MTIGVQWTGADNTVWDLINGPVSLAQIGVQAFGEPEYIRQVTQSAGRDGQRRSGLRSRAKARSGFLPVNILGTSATDWYHLSAGWWASWSPDTPGELMVTMPNGSFRTLECYFDNDNTYAPITDPTLTFTESVGTSFIADDPWWKGATVTAAFTTVTGTVDFFNAGSAPPFNLAAGNLLSGVQLNNPGDLEAWPVYTLTGPATAFSVSINGHVVSGSININTGETLVLDTDPSSQVAFLYGSDGSTTNVTPQLTNVDFGFIPTGTTVPTNVTVTGTGLLSIAFQPRYRRAW